MTHIHLSAIIVVALMIALPTGCIYNNAERQAKERIIRDLAEKYRDQIDVRAYSALMNYTVEMTD